MISELQMMWTPMRLNEWNKSATLWCLPNKRKTSSKSPYLANGPWNKSLNFIFPTKYVIPKSLKVSHWLSKSLKHHDPLWHQPWQGQLDQLPTAPTTWRRPHSGIFHTPHAIFSTIEHLGSFIRQFPETQKPNVREDFYCLRGCW